MAEINIIYLLPEMKGASGGAKVIYNHSLILNNINKNINSKIIHLKKIFYINLNYPYQKELNFLIKNTQVGMQIK